MLNTVVMDQINQLQGKLEKDRLSLMDIQMMRMIIQKLEPNSEQDPQITPLLEAAKSKIAQQMTG